MAAILSTSGFVESTLDDGAGPLGVVLEATPFYAEQGGQVADTGLLTGPSCSFEVQDTKVLRLNHPRKCKAHDVVQSWIGATCIPTSTSHKAVACHLQVWFCIMAVIA